MRHSIAAKPVRTPCPHADYHNRIFYIGFTSLLHLFFLWYGCTHVQQRGTLKWSVLPPPPNSDWTSFPNLPAPDEEQILQCFLHRTQKSRMILPWLCVPSHFVLQPFLARHMKRVGQQELLSTGPDVTIHQLPVKFSKLAASPSSFCFGAVYTEQRYAGKNADF